MFASSSRRRGFMGGLFSKATGLLLAALTFGQTSGALSQARGALETSLYQLRARPDLVPGGVYALETDFAFNVLDSIHYDPAQGRLLLLGHHDSRFAGPRIPYLQHLAALLEVDKPEFTLTWTSESERRVDDFLNRPDQGAKLAPYLSKIFEGSRLTPTGRYLLAGSDVSVIEDYRAPGFLGVEVTSSPGSVRVVRVTPDSPGERRGLQAGDEITGINDKAPVDAREFYRLVRFAGAGNTISLSYLRGGAARNIPIKLAQDADGDPWKDVTRYDIDAMLYRVADQPDRAKAIYAIGVLARLKGTPYERAAFNEVARSLGLAPRLGTFSPTGSEPAHAATELGRQMCRRLQEVFKITGNSLLNAYEAEASRAGSAVAGLDAAVRTLERLTGPTAERLLDRAFSQPGGVQIGPDLIHEVFGVRPEMRPEYRGVAEHSLLARAMFEGDYIGKQLLDRVDLKHKIPAYRTAFEFERIHPEFHRAEGSFHMWISVAHIDMAQSPSGTTLEFRDVRMRFNIREYGPDRKDLPNKPGGYEELLTSIYDALAQEYPTLHELREAAKLAAAAVWTRRKSPALHLPAAGRISWAGPGIVPGLVYVYLAAGATAASVKPTVIARGGVSLVPVSLTPFDWKTPKDPFPTGSDVLDLGPVLRERAASAPAVAAPSAGGPAGLALPRIGKTADAIVDGKRLNVGSILIPSEGVPEKLKVAEKPGGSRPPTHPPPPATVDPGKCTPDHHRFLQDEVEKACKGPKRTCRKEPKPRRGASDVEIKEYCARLMANLVKNRQCFYARKEIMDICFDGGDKRHHDQAEEDLRLINECIGYLLVSCGLPSPRHP
jgi:hypothetical protein